MLFKRSTYRPENPLFPNRALKKLVIPLIIEQALAVTVGMVDTIMISSVGEAAVSGISLVDMINILLINIFAALATGGAVVSSQFIGAQDRERAKTSASQLLFVTLMASLLLAVAALVFKRPILNVVFGRIEADVMENALTYLMYSALSYPFLALYNACAALFRSMGNSRISMLTSLLMNVINIVGNAILIFGFGMGVAGAAIATLVSRVVAAAVMLVLIARDTNLIYIDFKEKFAPNWAMIKKILYIGVPNGFENSFFQLGKILVLSIVTMFGTMQITANAVANNLASFGCIPGQAMGLSLITIVGQCVGAKDTKQAVYYTKRILKYSHAAVFVTNLFVIVCLPWILQLYSLSTETAQYATVIILIHNTCSVVFWPESFELPNALRAANDVRYTMWISIISMILFRIAFSYILGLGFGLGVIGVWIAMILDWIFRDIFFIGRFARGAWKKKI